MRQVGKYQVFETISETRNSIISRARHSDTNNNVIVKELRFWGNSDTTAIIRKNYEMVKAFAFDGVIAYIDIFESEGKVILVMEDFNGVSMNEVFKGKRMDILLFLDVAIKIAKTLNDIHQKKVIHRDIKPHNILVNQSCNIVKITDFGITSGLTSANEQNADTQGVAEGTLLYMSPEQTGRMNRAIDYRTDLYSLGVTFYELLTGELPFRSSDPMEIIHAHIAKRPLAPNAANPSIPEALSSIIMRLLEKNPDQRYQSSFGLMADLEHCRALMVSTGSVPAFELCQKDIPMKFIVPHLLCGRKREIELLHEQFQSCVDGNCGLVLVRGATGVGKTTLVEELQQLVVERNGYFIKGVYDSFNGDLPYSALIQSFDDLIRQLLLESNANIQGWKSSIQLALGSMGKYITDMIPSVTLIIGEQPPVPELGAEEFQHLFGSLFVQFVSVFTQRKHPLVLFLDDIHSIDTASVKILKILLTAPELHHFLVIGTYRDSESISTLPLQTMLEETKKGEFQFLEIPLTALNKESVQTFVAKILRTSEGNVRLLAELIYKKTGGNPFFIIQFIQPLFEEKLIIADAQKGWTYDVQKISKIEVTGNVIELLIKRIHQLPENTQNILKLCSCIGASFKLDIAAALSNMEPQHLVEILNPAIISEIVSFNDGVFSIHQRIHETLYNLIPTEKRVEIHYTIGKYLLSKINAHELCENVIGIVNHLNAGREKVSDRVEAQRFAELNLMASRRGRSTAAYDSAYAFTTTAISLLGEDAWDSAYELTLSIFNEAAENAYLCFKQEQMDKLCETILQRSKSEIDKVKAYDIRIRSSISSAKLKDAVSYAMEILGLLGVSFPSKPNKLHVVSGILQTKKMLRNKSPEYLENLPMMTDKKIIAIMSILMRISPPAYCVSLELFALTVFKRIELIILHGMSVVAPTTFLAYSIILCGVLEKFSLGIMYAKLSLKLMEKYNLQQYKGQILFRYYCMANIWRYHVRESVPELHNAFLAAVQVGDYDSSAYPAFTHTLQVLYCGEPLEKVISLADFYLEKLSNLKLDIGYYIVVIYKQFAENLKNGSEQPGILRGKTVDHEWLVNYYKEHSYEMGIAALNQARMALAYIYGEYDTALAYAEESRITFKAMTSTLLVPLHYFYDSLTCIANYKKASFKERLQYLKIIHKNQKKLFKYSKSAPMNYLHKWQLVNAELARIHGNSKKAVGFYELSLKNALENNYVNEAAMVCELRTRFHFELNEYSSASYYLISAVNYYLQLGAEGKFNHLKSIYPEIFNDVLQKTIAAQTLVKSRSSDKAESTTYTGSSRITSTSTGSKSLDIASMIKVSQALSGEMNLQKLLNTSMKLAIEYAGAERGFLIMQNENDDQLYIEASGATNEEIVTNSSIHVNESQSIPVSIINYVNKTRESLVISNAFEDHKYCNDPYIKKAQLKSILCSPIMHKGIVTGILYLENNLTSDAFTPDRLEMLSIFSSQAAISIENSKLYEKMQHFNQSLEEQVKNRTKELMSTQKSVNEIMRAIDVAIFTINRDLSINEGHSKAAEKMFQVTDFQTAQLAFLLNLQPEDVKTFKQWLDYVFTKYKPSQSWVKAEKLNPIQEVIKVLGNEKFFLKVEYQPIFEENQLVKIMVICRDISSQKIAEEHLALSKVEKELQLERVFGIVNNDSDSIISLFEMVDEAISILKEQAIKDMMENKEKVSILYRIVHTIKGNGGTMNFITLAKYCHEIEDIIQQLHLYSYDDPIIIDKWSKARNAFCTEYECIKELRERLFAGKLTRISVEKAELERVLVEIQAAQNQDISQIVSMVRKLSYKTWGEYCEKYNNVIASFVQKNNKQIDSLSIENKELKVSPKLCKVLDVIVSHCVRNAIDHGIEDLSTRMELSKGPGVVKLGLFPDGDDLRLVISDDGSGIDSKKVADSAINKGLITSAMSDSMSTKEKCNLIFFPGFSTKDEVTEFSGRGVGMDAVKECVEQLGGKIDIETEIGKGTSFVFYLPEGINS